MATVLGRRHWEAERTEEGHRNYVVRFLVQSSNPLDGPQTVTFAPGLPLIGQPWAFGNDFDLWAFCTPYIKITPVVSKEANKFWILEYRFTTRPLFRCSDTNIENPLLEPQGIRGRWVNGTIGATKDKDGNAIQTSSFEIVEAEFDRNLPVVEISQNTIKLGLSTFAPMVNNVNASTLWGQAARTVKLSTVSWERKVWGVCGFYYTRVFNFEVNPDTFDRDDVPNRGRKLIRGKWTNTGSKASPNWQYQAEAGVDINDPRDYIENIDNRGNPSEGYIIAASGLPSNQEEYLANVQYYGESNFLSLGIPTAIG